MAKYLKRYMIMAMLLSVSIVISYLESFIPIFVPGVKLGLANVIILIMIYEFKWHEALLVDILRILLVAIIRGTLLNPIFFMSLSGAIFSFVIMFIFSKIKIFTALGTSVIGSFFHAFGQILACMIIVNLKEVISYLPIIAMLSIGTGFISGFITDIYLRRSITNKFINSRIYNR